jgi:hypothetical protein
MQQGEKYLQNIIVREYFLDLTFGIVLEGFQIPHTNWLACYI